MQSVQRVMNNIFSIKAVNFKQVTDDFDNTDAKVVIKLNVIFTSCILIECLKKKVQFC